MKNPGPFIDWFKQQPQGENTLNYYLKEKCEYLEYQNNLLLETITDISKAVKQDASLESVVHWINNRCNSVLREQMNERE